jgi:hypothetical protein
MAPKEPIRLPLRWEFRPLQDRKNGLVTWTWNAYGQSGELRISSGRSFETFSECVDDAKRQGYQPPGADSDGVAPTG